MEGVIDFSNLQYIVCVCHVNCCVVVRKVQLIL